MRKNLKKIQDLAKKRRYRRKLSIRAKISGDAERPRLCVMKTNKHLSVQAIDDQKGITLLSVETFGKSAVANAAKTVEGGKVLGEHLGDKLKAKEIHRAVLDRNGFKYTGILKSLVDGVRAKGIKI